MSAFDGIESVLFVCVHARQELTGSFEPHVNMLRLPHCTVVEYGV
jgi:hypothetical protein